jgi:hypothetical protein
MHSNEDLSKHNKYDRIITCDQLDNMMDYLCHASGSPGEVGNDFTYGVEALRGVFGLTTDPNETSLFQLCLDQQVNVWTAIALWSPLFHICLMVVDTTSHWCFHCGSGVL